MKFLASSRSLSRAFQVHDAVMFSSKHQKEEPCLRLVLTHSAQSDSESQKRSQMSLRQRVLFQKQRFRNPSLPSSLGKLICGQETLALALVVMFPFQRNLEQSDSIIFKHPFRSIKMKTRSSLYCI